MQSDCHAAIALKSVSKRYLMNRTEPIAVWELLRHPLRFKHQLERDTFWALRDVTLDIKPGEVVGVIGANGSGKSTLLRTMLGITPPSEGSVEINGRIAGLLELGAGFHPNASGRDNVYLNGLLMGLSKNEIRRKIPEIIEFAGLEEFADQPTRTYSTGMHVRLGFAVAVHLQPDILLVDEVLAVGDAEFQEKCFHHFAQLRAEGRTVILVSHDLVSIRSFTERVVLLSHGHVIMDGEPDDVIREYLLHYVPRSEALDRFFARGLAFKQAQERWLGAADGEDAAAEERAR